MATVNVRKDRAATFEGAPATIPNATEQLKRAVMSCMLWEDSFYESGEDIADRIEKLATKVKTAPEIAIEARKKLRHAPLLICAALARVGKLKKETLAEVIQRPDEITEFLAIYWRDGKCPLSGQVKKGLALAFKKFKEYHFAKYTGGRERGKQIKMKDALRLSHAKLGDLGKKILEDNFKTIDTWETQVKKNTREEWEGLLERRSLPAMALLRNIRNMNSAGVPREQIASALKSANISRILPFRFITAASHNPDFEPELESLMFSSLTERPKLKGKTVLLVDVSASMSFANVSKRSELTYLDAACGLAVLARELCEHALIFTFSNYPVQVPPRRGFALKDAIINSQSHQGTDLGMAIRDVNKLGWDRLIVITDEQSSTPVSANKGTYIMNVASYNKGVEYGNAIHINGWSEATLDFIIEYESKISA